MKRILLYFMVSFFFYSNLIAQQTGWSEDTIIPTPPHLNCVSSFVCIYRPYRAGWIGGNNGTILYTSNSGVNWIYRTNSIVGNNNITSIAAVNDTIALCAFNSSNTTYILRTSNRGLNWQIVFQQQNGFIRSIRWDLNYNYQCYFITGYAIGDPVGGRWTILKTTDGGISFDSSGLYMAQSGNEIGFNNSLDVWYPYAMFGTNNGRVYRTTNHGMNWSSSGIPFQNISSLCDRGSDPTNYAGGVQTGKSTNFGLNWQLVTLPGSGSCVFNNEDGFYARGSEIYISGSPNFILNYTSPNGGNYTDISIFSSVFESGITAGWAVKDNGTVSKYYNFFSNVKKLGTEIPENFYLFQNYPNPFNPTTKIKFQIPKLSDVQLKIYDPLGREVAMLVNEKLAPGVYEVKWDGTNYPSGIYFYKLTTQNFSETKKLVLLK
jgi:hypothetical protein